MPQELGLLEGMMNIPMGTRPITHIHTQVVRRRCGSKKNKEIVMPRKIPRFTNLTARAVASMFSVFRRLEKL